MWDLQSQCFSLVLLLGRCLWCPSDVGVMFLFGAEALGALTQGDLWGWGFEMP